MEYILETTASNTVIVGAGQQVNAMGRGCRQRTAVSPSLTLPPRKACLLPYLAKKDICAIKHVIVAQGDVSPELKVPALSCPTDDLLRQPHLLRVYLSSPSPSLIARPPASRCTPSTTS